MMFSNFFKKPEYKRFNLTPRYWDPAKEEREERERRIKAELGIKSENGEYYSSIRGAFTRNIQHQSRSSIKRSSNLRVVIIFIVLAIFAYGYLFGWEQIVAKLQFLLNK
ncbi:MAG: hypothetical protein N4A49_06105 [Marinifilaceae bacterium]|jgi:hypothetical protein|nr:hypothetical protein [Marinifilaceae bacterium]